MVRSQVSMWNIDIVILRGMISAHYKGKVSSDEDDDDHGSRSSPPEPSGRTQSLPFSVEALMSKKVRSETTSQELIQMPCVINKDDRSVIYSVDSTKRCESVKEDFSWINKPRLSTSPRKLLVYKTLNYNVKVSEGHYILDIKQRSIFLSLSQN